MATRPITYSLRLRKADYPLLDRRLGEAVVVIRESTILKHGLVNASKVTITDQGQEWWLLTMTGVPTQGPSASVATTEPDTTTSI